MNAILAAVTYLFDLQIYGNFVPGPGPSKGGSGGNAAFFLRSGILICFIVILLGALFIYTGVTGQVILEVPGSKLTTGVVGLVLIFLGLFFLNQIGKTVLKDHG